MLKEGQNPVVEHIGCRERCLTIIEFRKAHLALRIDTGLLIHPADPFKDTDIKRILQATGARTLTFNSPRASLSAFAFSKATTRASVNMPPSCATFPSSAGKRFRIVSRSRRSPRPRTPAGEIVSCCFRSSLATRTCHQAGCSMAKVTIVSSTTRATRFLSNGFYREISCSAASPPVS